MKRIAALWAAGGGLCVMCLGGIGSADSLTNGLMAYWKFDESSGDAADSAGSRTLTNFYATDFAPGKINNGIDLGSNNTSKAFWRNENLGLIGAMSMSIWFKVTGTSSGTIFAVGSGASSPSYCGYYIEYDYNGGATRLVYTRLQCHIAWQRNYYSVNLGSDWNLIVLTYDGTNIRGYLNGSLVLGPVNCSGNGANEADRSNISIGAQFNSDTGGMTGYTVSGLCDEAGIWARELSASEVARLYYGGSGLQYPFEPPTVTPTPTPTPTLTPTSTLYPTYTPYPTVTPYPTCTPYPTLTPYATFTPYPTYTPFPTQTPTSTPTISPTPTITPTKGMDSPGEPSAGSGMYSLQQVYDYLMCGTRPRGEDTFQEPESAPGPTMKNLRQIVDNIEDLFDQCPVTAGDVRSGVKFFSTQPGNWGVEIGTHQ